MGKYHVIAPCKIGKTRHKPGPNPIEVDEKVAKILVASKSLRAATASENQDQLAELLAGDIDGILAVIGAADEADLKKFGSLEKKGAKRKEVLEAIEAEIEKRKTKK